MEFLLLQTRIFWVNKSIKTTIPSNNCKQSRLM